MEFDFINFQVRFYDTVLNQSTTYNFCQLLCYLLFLVPTEVEEKEVFIFYNIKNKKLTGLSIRSWGINLEFNFEKALILISYKEIRNRRSNDKMNPTSCKKYGERCYSMHGILDILYDDEVCIDEE